MHLQIPITLVTPKYLQNVPLQQLWICSSVIRLDVLFQQRKPPNEPLLFSLCFSHELFWSSYRDRHPFHDRTRLSARHSRRTRLWLFMVALHADHRHTVHRCFFVNSNRLVFSDGWRLGSNVCLGFDGAKRTGCPR